MLTPDPARRITIGEIMQHQWCAALLPNEHFALRPSCSVSMHAMRPGKGVFCIMLPLHACVRFLFVKTASSSCTCILSGPPGQCRWQPHAELLQQMRLFCLQEETAERACKPAMRPCSVYSMLCQGTAADAKLQVGKLISSLSYARAGS
jgi:hypothetical protein